MRCWNNIWKAAQSDRSEVRSQPDHFLSLLPQVSVFLAFQRVVHNGDGQNFYKRGGQHGIKEETGTGMKDILPKEMEIRNYVMNMIRETYGTFGFSSIETPCVEHIENLSSKHSVKAFLWESTVLRHRF